MRGERHVVMDEAKGGEGATGGTGGAAPDAASQAAAAGTTAGGGTADPGSLLAQGATTQDWLTQYPQFKVEVDGKPDVVASAAKLAGSYGELSKRMKDVGSPPKDPKEYTVTVPEALKGKYDPAGDPIIEDLKVKAHAVGTTQKQFDFWTAEWFARMPDLLAGGKAVTKEDAEKALAEVWKSPDDLAKNVKAAHAAAKTFGGDAFDRLADKFGNDPDFIRFAAAVGAELKEDTAPHSEGGAGTSYAGMSKEQLMAHEAYKNPRHPDYELVSKMVRAKYEKEHGTAPAL
jgi:hypothetical protein